MSRALFRTGREVITEEPPINLTPLIDVVFVILIMFIVIAPLLEMDHIELANSSAKTMEESNAVQESSPISIQVLSDNRILFNKQYVNSQQLVIMLKEAKVRYPNVTPQLFHDRKAHFGTYQSIKNAAEEAGFQKMDIVLKPG